MPTLSSQTLVLRKMFCAFILFSCIGHAVFAQEKSVNQAPAKSEKEQRVEIKAKQYDARREDTVTKLVVTEEEIKQYGESNIAEILKRQSGITINGNEIRMRGLANGYTQILIDGEPLQRGMTLDSINVNQIKRIEIVRSATADMSTQAIGGTINVVMKKVEVASRNLMMSLNQSATDSLKNINFVQSDKSERFSYGVTVKILDGSFSSSTKRILSMQDGLGKTYSALHARLQTKSSYPGLVIDPRYTWVLDNGDTVTLKNNLFYQKISNNNLTQWSSSSSFSERKQTSDDRKAFGTNVNWERQLSNEASLKLMIGFNYFDLVIDGSDQSVDLNSSFLLARQTQLNEQYQDWKSTGSYAIPLIETHVFKSGWDAAILSIDSKKVQSTTQNSLANEIGQAHVNRLAMYVQDEWQTSPTWSNYVGVRWEMFESSGSGNHFKQFKNNTSVLSPILQTLWKLPDSKENQVRLALARTFKNPRDADLIPSGFKSISNQATLPDRSGNPHLKPELALGWDASYEHFGENGLKCSASFYVKKIQNIIRRDISFINQRWVDMPVNDGDAQAHGIELDTKFPLSIFIEGAKNIELRANVARNWSTVDNVPSPNNRFAEQARLSANVGVDYKANDQWSSGASYTFTSGGDFQLSPQSSRYASVSRRLDAFVKWKLSKETTVRFVVRNLLAQDGVYLNRYEDVRGATINQEISPSFRQLGVTLEMKL